MTYPRQTSYVELVTALRSEFDPADLQVISAQLREHRHNVSPIGVLARAVHDARGISGDPGE